MERTNIFYSHGLLLNMEGYYIDLIMVRQYENGELFCPTRPDLYVAGQVNNQYKVLFDTPKPEGMCKPRWNGVKWEETATAEEMEDFEQTRTEEMGGTMPDNGITQEQRLAALEKAVIQLALGGVTNV